MQLTNLDFTSLNQATGNQDWNDTFAYWLLVLHDPSSLYAQDANEAQGVMAYQYDVEEQGNLEGEGPEGRLVPDVFIPIAPVTLAHRWSPFPAAIEALGQPLHTDVKKGDVLAVFTPQLLPEALGLTLDERHFDFLLQHACIRALKANALILLVGSPGWVYDSEDFLEEEPEIRKMMEEANFVYTLRKPKNTQLTEPTKPPVIMLSIDPGMARYNNVSLFPKKVAQAKAMLAKTNMDKLYELVAKSQQEAAK